MTEPQPQVGPSRSVDRGRGGLDTNPTRPRVLMAGPDVEGRGGMATVTALLLRHGRRSARVQFARTHVDGSVAARLRVWLRGIAAVLRQLTAGEVDVLHLHMSERGSVLRKGLLVLAARVARVPVLLHCHGAEFADSHQRLPRPVRALAAMVLRRAAALVVLGEAWREVYVGLLGVAPQRVRVLHNPVELPADVPTGPSARTAASVPVLFLGRYGHRKSTPELLAAVAALPEDSRRRLRLRMAGDGALAETRAAADRIDANIVVGGWLDPAGRDAALAAAAVFVLPSHDEGLPMAMLEAMAWGLVPVVTPVGAIPEVVRDGVSGLLVRPGDVPMLAAALHQLITDDALRDRLAAGARARAEDFSIESYVDQIGALWRELAGGTRSTSRRAVA